ncbi:unnamed protein product [Didymodactylos carnosus]|uniref:Ubiquitin-like protease family profile domain-containing protein n=1 Tax=Didymodactylos carnosus TaxID=1234261 RepID=A0A815HDE5_9BILA|nr:unnamed protein product [Didymodactylos carnosus]CAF1401876.1 unnamed protein product [Didymodactylos carnosus]CAF4208868.1 unnamed protein product [Didymodactylos carnosus]CAF4220677.1 unnamed protein product [Didymodactylos carnosus]
MHLPKVLLTKKFSNYAQYFNGNKRSNLVGKRKSFVRNAYNESNTTYWYNAEDIAQISSEWMKQFSDQNIRITQPLGQQQDRNLSTILIELLNEYKQDEKWRIIPLNIAGIHWITLALIYNKNKQ